MHSVCFRMMQGTCWALTSYTRREIQLDAPRNTPLRFNDDE